MGGPINKELWNIRKIRFGNETVFEKNQRTKDTPEAFITSEAEGLAICIHGHAIRSPQELGGKCCIGGELICVKCIEKYHCEIDGNVICINHSFEYGGKRICPTHSLMEKIRFSFRK